MYIVLYPTVIVIQTRSKKRTPNEKIRQGMHSLCYRAVAILHAIFILKRGANGHS